MATPTPQTSCIICCDEFTKQPHKKRAQCPYCDVSACVKCTQSYLMQSHEDPHCMGCRRGWTREVMDQVLLTTWINGEYKKHRQDVLLDRERSRLPAAQIRIERQKLGAARAPIRDTIGREILELERQLGEKRMAHARENRIISAYFRGEDPFAADGAVAPVEERRVFIMPCPAADCRGFLSQAYKCGVCEVHVCPDCREVKGLNRDAEHTCDPNTVETVRALKKETRPCPECGTNIFKIEGCDQMFCTHCNTPFSWTSGKKITNGAIHNPHYFEYLRATNGGFTPRNPGDIPCAGNLPGAWHFHRQIITKYTPHVDRKIMDWLYKALATCTHIQHVEIPNVTNRAEDSDNMEFNCRYLTGDITEVRWKQLLQQREKRRTRRDELRMRYEAFVGACADIYGRIMILSNEEADRDRATLDTYTQVKQKAAIITSACEQAKDQLLALREIFNSGLMDISRRYKCQVMQLAEDSLKRENKRFGQIDAPEDDEDIPIPPIAPVNQLVREEARG